MTTRNGSNHTNHLHERKPSKGKNEEGHEEFERESIVENPNFTGIRKHLRQLLLPHVKSGIHTVVRVQSTRSPRKTQFYEFVSITGTHNFMIAFFPVMFFVLGNYRVGFSFTWLIGLGIYIGNVLKDYLCLPRPIPPSLRLSFIGTKEFGFPSTHSVTAFNMPMYVLLLLAPSPSWFFIGVVVALIYTYLISYSRVYLGLHCVTDIVGGIAIALILLIIWQPLGLSDFVYDWLTNGSYLTNCIISVVAGVVLLTLHPEPVAYCPCFEDSACFIGSCVGINLAVAIPGTIDVALTNFSIPHAIIRYLIGVGIMLTTRFLLKPSMYKILPWFYDVFHFHGRRFLPHLSRKDDVSLQDVLKPIPSLSDFRISQKEKKPPHDVAIPSKYIVYTAMTFVGIGLGMRVIEILGLQ